MDDEGLLHKADALLARYRDIDIDDVPVLTEVVDLPAEAEAAEAISREIFEARLDELQIRMNQRIDAVAREVADEVSDQLRAALQREIDAIRADFPPRP